VVALLLLATGILLAGVVARKLLRRVQILRALRGAQRRDEEDRSLAALKEFADGEVQQAAWNQVVDAYHDLAQKVMVRIEESVAIPARAVSRDELLRLGVTEHQGEDSLWKRIVLLLEYCEWVRFGSSAGVVAEHEARARFKDWVTEAERVTAEVRRSAPSDSSHQD